MKPSIIILRVAFTIAIIDEGFKVAKFEYLQSEMIIKVKQMKDNNLYTNTL